jgi:hypothetical protein
MYLRQTAHHRGYLIEGQSRGGETILRVSPTQDGLPSLPWWRFRAIRAPWAKAVHDVAGYIDQALADIAEHGQSEPSAAAEHLKRKK